MNDTSYLSDLERRLKKLGDDRLIDAFHRAKLEHAAAPDHAKTAARERLHLAECVLIGRFGLGEHMQRYLAKYPMPTPVRP